MPSDATTLAKLSFEALLSRNGESASLQRGVGASMTSTPVTALIERLGSPTTPRIAGEGSEPTGATIQLLDTVAPKPTAGDRIVDGSGNKYRIVAVEFLGHCWHCTCAARLA